MKRGLFFVILWCASGQAAVFVGPGATGDQFLKIPVYARPLALGDSFTGVFGDIAALQYNPAGLVGISRTDMALTYQSYFENSSLQSFSVGFPVSNPLKDVNTGFEGAPYIPRDKIFIGLQYRRFNADDTGRNALGDPTGGFSIRDQLFQAAVGWAPYDQVSFGFSGKLIQRKIQDNSMSQMAFDGGLIWMINEDFSLGASLLNIGQDKAFVGEKDPIPTTVRVGAKWNAYRYASFLADLSEGRDNILKKSVGAEISPVSFIRFRLGAAYGTDLEYTGGLGVLINPNPSSPPAVEQETGVEVPPSGGTLDDLDKLAKAKALENQGPTLNFVLDYAARINQTLGATHTISLKILY